MKTLSQRIKVDKTQLGEYCRQRHIAKLSFFGSVLRDDFSGDSMNTVGRGVREIRIHVLGEWRVLYVAKFDDAIFVLHAFQKKSRKTRREDIELARQLPTD
ncbi:MAG TPA: type II toxin-antitoxin system RelE/ParE family toxin [Pyrinomonadaceae bacterium]|jgi:phage-related protein